MERRKLEDFNDWWFTGRVPAELLQPFRRGLFGELVGSLGSRQALAITGLRRVGKTTLMYQLIDHLLRGGLDPDDAFYYSFDEAAGQLSDVIEAYRETRGKDFREARTYVFLDEVQKLAAWPDQLKRYYDLYPKLKFVVSGSESLFVMRGSRERLPGRMYEFFLPTLTFAEFIEINGASPQKLPEVRRRQFFRRYIEHGGFPELAREENTAEVRRYARSSVVDKLVFKDILSISGVRDADLFASLLEIFSANPGMYLEYQSLAQQLGRDRRVVRDYIGWLTEGFLVRLLGNYRKGRVASLRKLKRLYLADNAVITAFHGSADDAFFGRMVENAAVNACGGRLFWRNRHEVDLVVDGAPIEVKYQPKILPGDLRGIREFMRKFGVREGTVVTREDEREMKVEEGTVKLVPADVFLLKMGAGLSR